MRDIFTKFWPLLTADCTMRKYIKSYPESTYRRAPSTKDRLVVSHHTHKNVDSPVLTGTFPCGRCDIWSFISDSTDIILPNRQTYSIKHRVTCKTVGVVYLAVCQCRCFYVGKTKRPFFKHIKDHITPLYKRLTTTALNRHIGCQHNFDCNVVCFAALEHVRLHVRGSGIDVRLLQLENKWIHSLDAIKYPGLNEYYK